MAAGKAVFQDVDGSGIAPGLMAYLDRVAARPEMRAMREESYRLTGLAAGHTALDVGCGLGHALGEMAQIVGAAGRVIGVELSEGMAREAARRVALPHVEVRLRDLLDLDIDDGSVDVARAERVFQHVTETARGCAQLFRVLRPGGAVAILDPDWTSLRVLGPDPALIEEVSAAWAGVHPNPRGVLDLRGALLDAGFDSVDTLPVVQVHDDLAGAAEKFPSLDPSIPPSSRPISDEVATRWFDALDDAAARNRFWCTLTAWTVVGRKG